MLSKPVNKKKGVRDLKPKIVVVVGQTATGKSDLGVFLADKFNGEVISADSRQVYKGLDLGTGKITKQEMRGIKHHLIDITSAKKRFSVEDFRKKGRAALKDILANKKIPIIVGGTGFYIDALVYDTEFPHVKPDQKLRQHLMNKDLSCLQKRLEALDIERYRNIDLNNKVRIIRAIEIAEVLGSVPATKKNELFDILWIGARVDESTLRSRINDRLIKRLRKGMVKEAETLHANGLSYKRMEELGLEYRYLSLYLQKKINKTELIENLQKEIWKYAKRQRTWWKRNPHIKWFSPSDTLEIEKKVRSFLT